MIRIYIYRSKRYGFLLDTLFSTVSNKNTLPVNGQGVYGWIIEKRRKDDPSIHI